MKATAARVRAGMRSAWHRIVTMPRGLRLLLVALAVAAGFIGVVGPLFNNGGAPSAEIAGQLPESATAGHTADANIALDNVGDSIINPVCVSVSGTGVVLASADFQGLDHVAAVGNRVCGGQLTGQESISVTIHFTLSHQGSTTVRLVPQQGSTVIGPVFTGTVTVS